MKVYLVNAFSLNMVPVLGHTRVTLDIEPLPPSDFCYYASTVARNALGHQGTVDFVNSLCELNLSVNRVEVTLDDGDVLLVVQPKTRLPEGKVLTKEEMMEMVRKGLVSLYLVRVRVDRSIFF